MNFQQNEIRDDSLIYQADLPVTQFLENCRGKSIFIYSANLEGIGLAKRLTALGLNFSYFIDSRQYSASKKQSFDVKTPEAFWGDLDVENTILINATKDRLLKKKITTKAEEHGFKRGRNFFIPTDLCSFFPTIEISGKCNLVCATCDMGLPGANKGRGHMSAETFKKTLSKLCSEIPFVNSIALYTWGEPLLNPEIAEIVKICNEYGVACEISTNLEHQKYLEEFIAAGPDQIVAPCAGTGARYERGRTGGTWEGYLRGLKLIKEYMEKYDKDINVRIMYHLYSDNIDRDYDEVKIIAEELGFNFIPILAHVFPGRVLQYALAGVPLPKTMADAQNNLVFDIDEQLSFSRRLVDKPCHIIKAFPTISWDGRVLHCCNMQGPYVKGRFLETPLEDFINLRNKSRFCTSCMNEGVHRYFDTNIKLEGETGFRKIVRI
jgi:MoaA/NifB/PqqE/SkfB family radical SAM enzyme